MLRNFLDNYFGFNRQQRNGLLVLLFISLLLLVIRLGYPLFIKPDIITLVDLPLVERKLDSAYLASEVHTKNNYSRTPDKAEQLFPFDPNQVTLEQLLQLGFKEKTAQVFLKFRNKGFVFRKKEDLRRIYGISDKLYTQLEPYIRVEEMPEKQVPEKTETLVTEAKPVAKPASIKLELNTADSAALVSLDGIGAVFAKRILKYRTMLGGYVSIEQVKEVYGFTEELFEKVKSSLSADAGRIKKINLNKDDFKVINKHPYLSFELTKSICDWRRKTIINADNLKEILNDPALYRKLLPYLSFE